MDPQKSAKRAIEAVGLKPTIKRSILEARLLGERLQFTFQSRPAPSDALLLAGPGRSGTTWLANVLSSVSGTQQIFEPLLFNPDVYELANWEPPSTSKYLRLHYLRPEANHPRWNDLLRRVLTGQYRTYETDLHRTSIFPKRYLIKEIRANLMLGYIYDHFRSQILYVTRHPCAVVASRMRLKWQVNLDELLNQDELIDDYLLPWVGEIERSKHDPVASHAIWWAVESMVAARELFTRPHYWLNYEDLLLAPTETLQGIFQWLGLEREAVPEKVLEQNSHTTWRESDHDRTQEIHNRLTSWKTRLSERDQNLILSWGDRLGVPAGYSEAIKIAE